jgi:hypothetical protein
MRARDLGGMGETKMADDLLLLAQNIAQTSRLSLNLVAMMRNLIGWKLTSWLCSG